MTRESYTYKEDPFPTGPGGSQEESSKDEAGGPPPLPTWQAEHSSTEVPWEEQALAGDFANFANLTNSCNQNENINKGSIFILGLFSCVNRWFGRNLRLGQLIGIRSNL